ncbi:hypothetical protein LTR36_006280 [Oleoguttula mirabilis]|uniref:Uncharacterized protein n=1 Tax=Oleoguttula mirabilis TaxID=1507867 RepID=A0AAV9JD32_9PEZI|nr:hypothetical protein LTR36_006280 [Oleoguttula mirabilis]
MLIRRGGDGDPTAVIVVVACIVIGIVVVLLLMGWVHKCHKKASDKRRGKTQRRGWNRPAKHANAKQGHGGIGGRLGRSQGVPADEEHDVGGFAKNGGYGAADQGYAMQAPSSPESAHVRGNAPPPPSHRSVRDVRFPGPRYGYSLPEDQRTHTKDLAIQRKDPTIQGNQPATPANDLAIGKHLAILGNLVRRVPVSIMREIRAAYSVEAKEHCEEALA